MQDNEIIKALKCCINSDCKCCPHYRDISRNCEEILTKEVFDLFSRQMAEIESLKAYNNQLNSNYVMLKNDYDNFKSLYEDEKVKYDRSKRKVINAYKMLKTAKSEAIKEFAERVKIEVYFILLYYKLDKIVPQLDHEFFASIEKIEKEMTEGEK